MSQTTDNGKMVAIISYFWIVGWIIAIILHNREKSDLGAFHIRQTLGLLILWVIIYVINLALVISGLDFLGYILSIGLFILWLLGFIGAIQGEKKLVPGIGAQFQEWFKGIG